VMLADAARTYAVAVDGLTKREYVREDRRHLVPTPLGEKIYDALAGKFSFVRVDYTRRLEQDLDAIHAGKKRYTEVVRGVFDTLRFELAALGGASTPRPSSERKPAVDSQGKAVQCPKCRKPMLLRTSQHGPFYGCSGYPSCKGIRADR